MKSIGSINELTLGKIYAVINQEAPVEIGAIGYLSECEHRKEYKGFSATPAESMYARLQISDPVEDVKTDWLFRNRSVDFDVFLNETSISGLVEYEIGDKVELEDLKQGDKIIYHDKKSIFVATVDKPMHGNWAIGKRVDLHFCAQYYDKLHECIDYQVRKLVPKDDNLR